MHFRYFLARRTLSTHCKEETPTKITTYQNFKKITGLWVLYMAVRVNSQNTSKNFTISNVFFYRRSNGNLLWMKYSLATLQIVTHCMWWIRSTWRSFIKCSPAFKTGKWKYEGNSISKLQIRVNLRFLINCGKLSPLDSSTI